MVETKLINNVEYKSLQSERFREYIFDSNRVVVIVNPLWLNVSESGGHRVVVSDTETYYIPPGWLAIFWETKEGEGPVQF